MIRMAVPLASTLMLAACTADDGSGLTAADRKALEQKAVLNTGCIVEDQFACAHLIENRTLLNSFFTPKGFGDKDEAEKVKGRRVTKNYVVDAVSGIKQCRRTSEPVLRVLAGLEIAGGHYQVQATSPVSEQSSCFMIPEAS